MSEATPQMREVAARLISTETMGASQSSPLLPAVVHICEKLRPHLATLMGKAGFRAVLSRAVAVVNAETPGLTAVKVSAEGALEGWETVEAALKPKVAEESAVLLVAQVLGLLTVFIGLSLTLRLVRDVWPNLSLEDLPITKGDS